MRKGRKFVFDASFRQDGVGFQRAGASGPKQVASESIVPRVGRKVRKKAARQNEEKKRIDVLAVVENMEQDVRPRLVESVTSRGRRTEHFWQE